MPKRKPNPPGTEPEPQIERFRQAMRDLEAASELNPTEADQSFDQIVSRSAGPVCDK
jgi:hypothetical protein